MMRELRAAILFLLAVAGMFCLPPDAMHTLRQVAMATTYYVQTDGDNGNAGTDVGELNAWADIGYAGSQVSTGDVLYVKAGTYNLTNSTANTAGGPFSITGGRFHFFGYEDTPGDNCPTGNRPVISDNSQGSAEIVNVEGSYGNTGIIANIEVDGTDTATDGLTGVAAYSLAVNCVVNDCTGEGITALTPSHCKVAGCSTGISGNAVTNCWVDDCDEGIVVKDFISRCLATNCTSIGLRVEYRGQIIQSTVASQLGGVAFSTSWSAMAVDCLAVDVIGHGYTATFTLVNCGDYLCSSGRRASSSNPDWNAITLTASPFSTGYSLNDTTGGGALCRAAGIGLFGQDDYIDIGAVQHADPSGGGGDLWPWMRIWRR